MLSFNLLRVPFARDMSFGRQMPGIRPPMIGKETRDAERLQEGFELQEHLVLATATHIPQDFPRPVIEGMPQPPGFFLLAYVTPHFVGLCGLYPANAYFHFAGMQAVDQRSVYRREGRPLLFNS